MYVYMCVCTTYLWYVLGHESWIASVVNHTYSWSNYHYHSWSNESFELQALFDIGVKRLRVGDAGTCWKMSQLWNLDFLEY